MHPACERESNKKSRQYIWARGTRDFREMGPQSVINERESNGKLIGFDDSQVWE